MDELKPPPMSDEQWSRLYNDWLATPRLHNRELMESVIAARDQQWLALVGELQRDAERRHQLLIMQHAESVELWNALKDLSFECDGVFKVIAPSRETYNRTFDVLQKKNHLSPQARSGHACQQQNTARGEKGGV